MLVYMLAQPRTKPEGGRYSTPKLVGWRFELNRRESGIAVAAMPLLSIVGLHVRSAAKIQTELARHEDDPLAIFEATPKQAGRLALAVANLGPDHLPAVHVLDHTTGHHETVAEALEATQHAYHGMIGTFMEIKLLPTA